MSHTGNMASDTYVIISPGGDLTWHTAQAESAVWAMVEAGVGSSTAGQMVATGEGLTLRLLASDIAFLDSFQDKFPPNERAHGMLRILSGGRITQLWRGYVALYLVDREGWTVELTPEWAERIKAAARDGHP